MSRKEYMNSLTVKRSATKADRERFYVNPIDMWNEIDGYYEAPPESVITEALGSMISKICEKIGYMMSFKDYSWLDEMRGEAIVHICESIINKNFSLWSKVKIKRIEIEPSKKRNGETYDKTIIYYDFFDRRKKIWVEKGKEVDVGWGDYFYTENNTKMFSFRNNPFSYYSKVAYHAYVHRLKLEKKAVDIREAYQEKIWEDQFCAGGSFENTKRPTYNAEVAEDEYNGYDII